MTSVTKLFLILASVLFTPLQEAGDPIRSKLEKEKTKYDEKSAAIEKSISEWFDEQAARYRKKGDKNSVDRLNDLQEQYNKIGILPATLPKMHHRKLDQLRSGMQRAFEKAISDYTKSGQDSDATTVQSELQKFLVGIGAGIPVGEWNVRYFNSKVRSETLISKDLQAFHVDNIGRREHGSAEVNENTLVIKYPKFVEVWKRKPNSTEIQIDHYFPASTYPSGKPSHQAIGTPKPSR